jgi:ABC-type xylose transport system permease subunit
MAFQMPELGILALAMMIPLMSGGLNLAIIATANLSALVMAVIITKLIGPASPPQAVGGVIALALAAGLMTSLVVGLITGAIVAFLGVHPILVRLGTMTAVKGIAVYATNGGVIGGFPPAISFLGNGMLLGVPVRTRSLDVPPLVAADNLEVTGRRSKQLSVSVVSCRFRSEAPIPVIFITGAHTLHESDRILGDGSFGMVGRPIAPEGYRIQPRVSTP